MSSTAPVALDNRHKYYTLALPCSRILGSIKNELSVLFTSSAKVLSPQAPPVALHIVIRFTGSAGSLLKGPWSSSFWGLVRIGNSDLLQRPTGEKHLHIQQDDNQFMKEHFLSFYSFLLQITAMKKVQYWTNQIIHIINHCRNCTATEVELCSLKLLMMCNIAHMHEWQTIYRLKRAVC